MRNPNFGLCENKDADQLCSYIAQLISAFVFATGIVQFLFSINPKFQASNILLGLYRPIRVGAGRKPRRLVFWRRGSNDAALKASHHTEYEPQPYKIKEITFSA